MKKVVFLLVLVLGLSMNTVSARPTDLDPFGDDDGIVQERVTPTIALDAPTVNYDNPYWENDMEDYNCYGYALGVNLDVAPGDYSNGSAWTATNIKNDLEALDYVDVTISTSFDRPGENGYVIAFRLGEIQQTTLDTVNDYHVMKYDNGVWTHKPGGSAVLTLKPQYLNADWPLEFYKVNDDYLDDGWYQLENQSYDGTIYFITYYDEVDELPDGVSDLMS